MYLPTYLYATAAGAVIKLCCIPLHSNLQSTSQKIISRVTYILQRVEGNFVKQVHRDIAPHNDFPAPHAQNHHLLSSFIIYTLLFRVHVLLFTYLIHREYKQEYKQEQECKSTYNMYISATHLN